MIASYVVFSLVLSASGESSANDAWVTMKVRLALLTADNVKSGDVHVDTNDGLVTLFGHVDSTEAKATAERKVAEMKGVKHVVNELQVIPSTVEDTIKRSDDEIKKAAENALKSDSVLKDSSFKILSVDNGSVVLGGKAKDTAAHLAAMERVSELQGVRRVMSRVDVEHDTPIAKFPDDKTASSTPLRDSWITSKVKVKLMSTSGVPANAIHVETRHGKVTLWGVVENDMAKRQAEAVARNIDGVVAIENGVIVDARKAQHAEMIPDREIKEDVERLLSKENLHGIDVDVKDGIVELSGKVPSEAQRERVSSLTKSARGARSVRNEIKVDKR